MAKDIPIPAETGKNRIIVLRVRQDGMPRTLTTHGDLIRFVVTKVGQSTKVIEKSTNSGISQDDQGWAQITLTPQDLLRSKFDPNYDYEYDIEVEDGLTGLQWPLASGPFQIDITPQ